MVLPLVISRHAHRDPVGVLPDRGEPPPTAALLRRGELHPRRGPRAPRHLAGRVAGRAPALDATTFLRLAGGEHLPQPDPLRRLVRPRRDPRRRRLLARRVELPRGAGSPDPPLEGPRPLDARGARGAAPPLAALRRPPPRRRRLGPLDPLRRRLLPRLVRRSRRRHLHDPRPRPAGAVGAAPAREGGARVDRPVPVPRRGRLPLARPRLGEEPRGVQRDPDRPPPLARRPLRRRRRGEGLRRRNAPPDDRGAEALPARRVGLHLRPRRRREDRLADGAAVEERPRPLGGADRPRPGRHSRQRAAPGRPRRHALGRVVVRPLPGPRRVRAGHAPPAGDLARRLAGHRRGPRRRREGAARPRPRAAGRRTRHAGRLAAGLGRVRQPGPEPDVGVEREPAGRVGLAGGAARRAPALSGRPRPAAPPSPSPTSRTS